MKIFFSLFQKWRSINLNSNIFWLNGWRKTWFVWAEGCLRSSWIFPFSMKTFRKFCNSFLFFGVDITKISYSNIQELGFNQEISWKFSRLEMLFSFFLFYYFLFFYFIFFFCCDENFWDIHVNFNLNRKMFGQVREIRFYSRVWRTFW